MTKQSYIFVSLFIAILLLSLMLGFSFMIKSSKQANAEYIDVINDTSALVNFNQLIAPTYNSPFSNSNGFIIATTTANTDYTIAEIGSLTLGHKYYLRFVGGVGFNYIQVTNNYNYALTGIINWNNGSYDNLYTCSNDSRNFYLTCNTSSTTFQISIMLIDVSSMFGVGNEPNLLQCQELFVADYYPYNTGTPVSINGLSSYAQGYSNALNSLNTQYEGDMLTTNTFTSVGTNYSDFDGIWVGVNIDNNLGYGQFGFRFPSTLFKGDTISIEFNFVEFDYGSTSITQSDLNDYLYVGYFSNGEFVSIASWNNTNLNFATIFTDQGHYFSYYRNSPLTFNLPADTNVIYFRSNRSFMFTAPRIKVTTTNLAIAIDNSYKDGYSNAETTYKQILESYYGTDGIGGSNYEAIWNEAYNVGLNDNVSNARKKTYTFTSFLGALFDVPVSTIKSLLDFNFLGFNLKNFVFSLLTLSIVFALIKLILVKTGDGK